MQTPGRVVQSQTPMFSPLGERMENANTKLIERSEERLRETGISRQQTRQLGRIILEFERLNGSMKTMRSEIQQDLRARRKYYREERKILKEDLENTNLFKTAALFDGRKNLALLSGALALKEASDGDFGGALQATGAAVGLLLPEIIGTVLNVIGLNSIAGGGRGVNPRGNVGGIRGIRGMGGKNGIIAAAIIAASLLGSRLFGGSGNADTRRQEGAQQTIAGVNTINEPDVSRFKVQLNRFESILDGMMSGPSQIGNAKKGKTNPPAGPLGASGNDQLNTEIGEATDKNDFSKGFGSGEVKIPELTTNNINNIISGSGTGEEVDMSNFEASGFSPITEEDIAREKALELEYEKETGLLSNNSNGSSSILEPTTKLLNPVRTSSSEVLEDINNTSNADTSMNLLDSSAITGSSGFVSGSETDTNVLADIDLSGGSIDEEKKIMKGESLLSKLDPRNWFKQNRNEDVAVKSGTNMNDLNVINNPAEEGSGLGSGLPGPGDGQVQVNVDTRYRVNSGTSIDKFEHNSSLKSYTTFRP